MKKKLFIILFCAFLAHVATAQNSITGYEYWFNSNYPAKVYQAVSPADTFNLPAGIDATALNPGYHVFNSRFQNANGSWSVTKSSYFLKQGSATGASVIGYEYWFDNNYPAKIYQAVSPADTFNLTTGIDATTLNPGYHIFNIRFQNGDGQWGSTKSSYFLKQGSVAGEALITAWRYWIDTSTNVTTLTFPLSLPASTVDIQDSINTQHLDTGYHWLYFQTKDASGLWSSVMNKRFRTLGKPRLDFITPKQGGNTGDVTINVYGRGFYPGTSVKLAKGTDTIHIADTMIRNIDGLRLAATANLRGRSLGDYDVIVKVPTLPVDTSMKLTAAFKIVAGDSGRIIVKMNGPSLVRAGSEFRFTVTATNTGNIDRPMPYINVISFNSSPLGYSKSDLSYSWKTLPAFQETEYTIIPSQGTMEATMHSQSVAGGQSSYGISQFPKNDNPQGVIPNGCSVPIIGNSLYPRFVPACNRHDICYGTCRTYRKMCDVQFFIDMNDLCVNDYLCNNLSYAGYLLCNLAANKYYEGVSLFGSSFYNNAQNNNGCSTDGPPTFLDPPPIAPGCGTGCPADGFFTNSINENPGPCYSPVSVFAVDPNEKTGPSSLTAAGHVNGSDPFYYKIHFENDSAATAAAQTVTIIDTLNRSVFDLRTFKLGNISIADTTVPVPPGLIAYSNDIDLTSKGIGFICHVDAALDTVKGIAQWKFTTLDPVTMLPVTGALDGFLPPNKTAPQGQASVSYSIKVFDTVTVNTIADNKAHIYFDNLPPIATATWSNTIDNVKPVSSVSALPVYSDSLFNIHWWGSDAHSGILSYEIYYAVNAGPYRLLTANTSTTSYLFHGLVDTTYSFYSIATDKAGNKEMKTIGEASTTVRLMAPLALDLLQFNVTCNSNSKTLKWRTVNDRAGTVYSIERSVDGAGNWATINSRVVSGNGDHVFVYTDLTAGGTFYRIKQVDHNGAIYYSTILRANCAVANSTVKVYPLPADAHFNVLIETGKDVDVNLLLADVSGKMIFTQKQKLQRGSNSLLFSTAALPNGYYILKVQGLDMNYAKKVVVVH